MKINDLEICDENMHMVVVEGEAVSLLTSKTGSWRSVRPVISTGIAPCTDACPAKIRIRDYLAWIETGQFDRAWKILQQNNPFAAITGRVCPCFCEPACNRGRFDEPIAIRTVERLLGDYGLKKGFSDPALPADKEKVAIIGSGPAGLSAAFDLRQKGYRVTVFEALDEPGGMLFWGVPEFRLPKDIVRQLIDALRGLEIDIRTGVSIGKDLSFDELKQQDFKAVLVAVGAQKDLKLNIPGFDADGIFPGVDFLRKVNASKDIVPGEKVTVIGGGNTAIDAARVAKRQGAGQVDIIYRRSRAEMPAIDEEVEAALSEGITMQFQVAPKEIRVLDGKVSGIQCLKMDLGALDDSGRKRPVPVEGSEFDLEADAVIVAIGQQTDLSFLEGSDQSFGAAIIREGLVAVDPETMATGTPELFAAGDVETGPWTVIHAISGGKKASLGIDRLLHPSEETSTGDVERVIGIDDVNLNYFQPASRTEMDGTDLEGQKEAAAAEAGRCFYCGVCTVCNTCWFMCPDAAITRDQGQIKIDYDYCKGCAICAEECPCGAITIEEESKWQ